MPDYQTRLQYLYVRFIHDEATADEVREFWELMRLADKNDPVKKSIFKLYGNRVPEEIERKDWGRSISRIMDQPEEVHAKLISYKWWAAASVILLLGAFSYFYFGVKEAPAEVATSTIVKKELHDIAPPASNMATITLANGQKILLDSMSNGVFAKQNNVELKKTGDGEIVYDYAASNANQEIIYNTLSNPRGSKVIDLVLSDGSHLWLNSGSSVTFPVAFSSDVRKVSITGEAYFEVAHNQTKKFIVNTNDITIEVLGTHFNVNAYEDVEDIKVTLLKGSIKVKTPASPASIIKPEEQAVEMADGQLKINRHVDVESVIAWKNDMFSFNNTNIKDIMKEVSRWYDVNIDYRGDFSDLNFGGNMSRQENVSELLKRLEATKAVRFEVIGKTITVIQIN